MEAWYVLYHYRYLEGHYSQFKHNYVFVSLQFYFAPLTISFFNLQQVDMGRRTRSFPQNGAIRPSHSKSFPTFRSQYNHQLLSVRSEGDATVRKNSESKKFSERLTPPRPQKTEPKRCHLAENSSDESGGEDELIVRVDSPSRLSFQQAS